MNIKIKENPKLFAIYIYTYKQMNIDVQKSVIPRPGQIIYIYTIPGNKNQSCTSFCMLSNAGSMMFSDKAFLMNLKQVLAFLKQVWLFGSNFKTTSE